jgi:hypothetical protein
VAWNLPQDRLVWEERIGDKVNFIEPCPVDSNLLLIGSCAHPCRTQRPMPNSSKWLHVCLRSTWTGNTGKSNQLALYDRRAQARVLQLDWTPQTSAAMSQFIHPAWSPCGTFVSSYASSSLRLLLERLRGRR